MKISDCRANGKTIQSAIYIYSNIVGFYFNPLDKGPGSPKEEKSRRRWFCSDRELWDQRSLVEEAHMALGDDKDSLGLCWLIRCWWQMWKNSLGGTVSVRLLS